MSRRFPPQLVPRSRCPGRPRRPGPRRLWLGLTVWGALTLLVLFSVQFVTSITLSPEANQLVIIVLSVVYGVLAIGQFLHKRRDTTRTLREGLITPFPELADARR